ncbi:hypothetical protein AB0P21_21650 [Kribbella sp. NPDC056861]|uniref:hypothetical protein n=1 Tax=Kribbella sp. NPDC056861 TaxID=3154857 RepID=UPI003435F30E
MKLQRLALTMVAISLFAATAAPGPALAAVRPNSSSTSTAQAAAVPCVNRIIWPDAANFVAEIETTAGKPPRLTDSYGLGTFVPNRSMTTWYITQSRSGTQYSYGLLLQGANLYRHTTFTGTIRTTTTTKLGTGWLSFKSIATSRHTYPGPQHAYLYGLNNNGNLYRYAANGAGYKAFGSFGGFKSFKTMAVISETATYDTLLMTTTAGALYTIHIPVSAKAKPVVKLIRKSGWSSFESLHVEHCGWDGNSVVVGIDNNTDSGYQYHFTKANGTATAITSYGKVPAVFNGATAASRTMNELIGE